MGARSFPMIEICLKWEGNGRLSRRVTFFREGGRGDQEAIVVKARGDGLDSGGQFDRNKDGLSVW